MLVVMASVLFISCNENKTPEEKTKEVTKDKAAADNFDDLVAGSTNDTLKQEAESESKTTAETTAAEKTEANETTSVKGNDYSKTPLVGEIVVLTDLGTGNFRKLTKESAKSLVSQGHTLVLKVGQAIYFVYNEDGSSASKKLSGYANNVKIGMIGKAKVVDGVNIFIASMIESM